MVQKIAVLGGGAGALSAVYGITRDPFWAQKYEITVYQLGWRLGGKGASGRYQSQENRFANIEHGLHVFGGDYHNAFGMLRTVYGEWQGLGGALPIPFDDAFIAQQLVHVGNRLEDGGWAFVPFEFPQLPGEIGVGGTELSPVEMVICTVQWLRQLLTGSSALPGGSPADPNADPHLGIKEAIEIAPLELLAATVTRIAVFLERHRNTPIGELCLDVVLGLVDTAIGVLRDLDHLPRPKDKPDFLLITEIAMVGLRGMIKEDVLTKGYDALNHWEFKAFLAHYGLSAKGLVSYYVRTCYDYLFAYENGDTDRPNIAAGVALRGLMRLSVTYHDALFWHLDGGMGEIVFTPLYEVLKAQGVKFRFFTQIDALKLSADKSAIEEILATSQAEVIKGEYDYDPLFTYAERNRRCWPLEPFFDQLKDGGELKKLGDGFESYWVRSPAAHPLTLRRGYDYDLVILGISVGALETICADLTEKLPDSWGRMIATQMAIPTIGAQYWLKDTVEGLGWTEGRTVLTAYEEPLATWGDMSFLLKLETDAPNGTKPKSLAYFCGQMRAPDQWPKPPDPDFPEQEWKEARAATEDWVKHSIDTLWPKAGVQGLDPEKIYSVEWKANIDPSERYVLSRADTIKTRFRAGDSGIDNLFLAGDWLKTGLDAGCFEAAVMGGLECANALAGTHIKVYGATDFPNVRPPLPDFIDVPGNQIAAIPYVSTKALMQSFFVEGDKDKLQAVVDQVLNQPAKGRLEFKAASKMVLLTSLFNPHMTSADPDYAKQGYAEETDVGFWILTYGGKAGNPLSWQLRWLPVYLFVDMGTALSAGREVFGFPKNLGTVARSSDARNDGRVSVATVMFLKFDPDTRETQQPLFEVRSGAGGHGLWHSIDQFMSEVEEAFADELGEWMKGEKTPVLNMPMIFLKQFRDAAEAGKACFQEIVASEIASTRIYDLGGLDGGYHLWFADADSYPLARTLGIRSGQDLKFPMWVEQDYSVGFGTIL